MSKRILTTLTKLTVMITFVITLAFINSPLNNQADLIKPCMAVNSNLPMSHSSHPCNAGYMSQQSWWTWASNDRKSVHLHFLDLIELMHHEFF